MRIGVPREIKVQEHRVALTPAAVGELVARGHQVTVQAGAGAGVDFSDDDYRAAGAAVAATAAAVFLGAELIVKVKELQPSEYALLQPGQVLFAYLHLAADPAQAEALLRSGAVCVAYETVTDARGGLPLLRPMSEIAGRMSPQVGARCLEKEAGGRGVLLGGAPGVLPGAVVILGGGVAGAHAAEIAAGLRADVRVYDISAARLAEIDQAFGGRVKTGYASSAAIAAAVREADLVIGAVLAPGAAAPKLVTRDMVRTMRRGAVLVDIAIDQGGCFETSRPTTHDAPTFVVDDIVHYCVANMPGAVPRTSTEALNHAILPFVAAIADKGAAQALADDPHLRAGLNVADGAIRHRAVAQALGLPFIP